MSTTTELWLEQPADEDQVAAALLPFGELKRRQPGVYQLVETDDDDEGEAVRVVIFEDRDPPREVAVHNPEARWVVQINAAASGSRGFWLARVTFHLQSALGGTVWVPDAGEAFVMPDDYAASWPGEHKH